MIFRCRLLFCFAILSFLIHQAQADTVTEQNIDSSEISVSNSNLEPSTRIRVIIRKAESAESKETQSLAKPLVKALPYDDLVSKAALATQLAPALIHAVIAVESQHNTMALSTRGAMGLMQLMPGTAHDYRVSNPYNPKQNIFAGARYLKSLLELFEGDLSLALAAYNAGPQKVKRYGMRIPPFAETQAYVARVLMQYQAFGVIKSAQLSDSHS